MRVEALKLILRLPHTTSLKDKRRILKSLMARCQQDYHVSIAEVDLHDDFRAAALGVALVSNDSVLNENILKRIIERLDEQAEVVLEDHQRDFLNL